LAPSVLSRERNKTKSHCVATLPPGPPGRLLPTYRSLADSFRYFPVWRERYGDPFTVHGVNGTIVIASDPTLIHDIFSADPGLFDPFGARAIAPLLGAGSLLVLHGDAHKRERKLLTPPFHGARMRAYGEQMQAAACRHFESAGGAASFQRLAQRLSLEIIVRAVFGADEAERLGALTARPSRASSALFSPSTLC
jgi:cytochrome P450